jgi:hypothetical protein
MSAPRWVSAVFVIVALVAGAMLWLQHQATLAFRSEVDLLRDENRRLARMRVEHERLLTVQPSGSELERLRADHAALVRFRTEIEQMKARAEQAR